MSLPGETWRAPKGTTGMTLVVISRGEEHVQRRVDPDWNIVLHTPDLPGGGFTFIDKLHVWNVISHVPCQPEDSRFVVKRVGTLRGKTELLVLAPEGEDQSRMIEESPTEFQWPRRKVSVWERLRKPEV